MFCPTCGKENPRERKFCSTCGTNLEVVSQALTGSGVGTFSRFDSALDQFIARYAERVFKDAPAEALDPRLSNSWKILGQGIVTSFVDQILFLLIWNILPLRFLILLLTSPIRLLAKKRSNPKLRTAELEKQQATDLPDAAPQHWIASSAASVTEHTTANLPDYARTRESKASKTE